MFVGYERRREVHRRRAEPYVSINRRGEIVMNGAALRQVMTLDRISLCYEKETNRIGVSRGSTSDPSVHVFRGRRHGRNGRLRVFRARRFLKHFGIAITETLVFRDAPLDEYMLILDLRAGAANAHGVSEARV